jgi:hypothetical protein
MMRSKHYINSFIGHIRSYTVLGEHNKSSLGVSLLSVCNTLIRLFLADIAKSQHSDGIPFAAFLGMRQR